MAHSAFIVAKDFVTIVAIAIASGAFASVASASVKTIHFQSPKTWSSPNLRASFSCCSCSP